MLLSIYRLFTILKLTLLGDVSQDQLSYLDEFKRSCVSFSAMIPWKMCYLNDFLMFQHLGWRSPNPDTEHPSILRAFAASKSGMRGVQLKSTGIFNLRHWRRSWIVTEYAKTSSRCLRQWAGIVPEYWVEVGFHRRRFRWCCSLPMYFPALRALADPDVDSISNAINHYVLAHGLLRDAFRRTLTIFIRLLWPRSLETKHLKKLRLTSSNTHKLLGKRLSGFPLSVRFQ